jgi:predicted nucleic acid-binding protein
MAEYEIFISPFVLRELEEGVFPNQEAALALANRLALLAPGSWIEEIVVEYLDNYLMPRSDERDAIHLAFASYYKMDYLLTWNCAHLANVNKRKHIEQVNRRLGLFVPAIITPLELRLNEGSD